MRSSRWTARLLVPMIASLAVLMAMPGVAQTRAADTESGKPQPTLPIITLTAAAGIKIRTEVANSEPTRNLGMMFRTRMGRNEGMLFVFERPGYYAMWMRNTLIPLSVAYLDSDGVIVSIHEMAPRTENPHQAAGPVIYALEMNANWFANNNVKPGDRIVGLDKAPKAR